LNSFLDPKAEVGESSRRIYARVDSIESTSFAGDEEIVYLDGIDADWFDRKSDEGSFNASEPASPEEMEHARLSVLAIYMSDWPPALRKSIPGEIGQGAWLAIEQKSDGPVPAERFDGLFAVATATRLSITAVAKDLAKLLDKTFSLDNVADASELEIESVIKQCIDADFINVLDVGQGNACGLWKSDGGALLYFDLGGGVVANVNSFPKAKFRSLCISRNPPVVLSHWDWDHWSSALRFPAARQLQWLVPRQDLGPVHRAFAYQLDEENKLLVWPKTLPSKEIGGIRIEKCTGRSQNDSGLAMSVARTAQDGTIKRALLPGDADFSSIPSALSTSYDALIASHHGSSVSSINLMNPAQAKGVLAYSCGHGNSFGHPKLHALLGYMQAGWQPSFTLTTTQSRRKRPCHVGIELNGSPARSACTLCTPAFTK
jgi:beta-lactamase superfamily II metal-dependent hydrolase